MASIIDKPDLLSLSGNLRKFELGATGVVKFVLKKGNEVLLRQSYEPGPNGLITIDIKDVVESRLHFTLNTAQTIYTQPNIAADFTAEIDDASPYTFRVVRAGVQHLADTSSNWLKQHFLTWQPKVKKVTYYSPEWLSYYAVVDCSVMIKAVFPNGSDQTTTLQSCAAGSVTTFNLQYGVVAGKFSNRYPIHYEVWAQSGSTKLTESQFYQFDDLLSEDEQWYIFENSLGGIDTFRAYGVNDLNAAHDHSIAILGDSQSEYRVDTERKFTKNTGFLNEYDRRWFLDFFPSRKKYIYEDASIREIIVSSSNVTYQSSELPSSFTFTYQLSKISRYLNLIRNEKEIPGNIIIPSPDSPDFIFPPRLVEYPRIELTEGVLIPAFDPHNPQPTVTTFSAIHDTIKNSIINELKDIWEDNFGGGGTGSDIYIIKLDDLTVPSDENVFSALRTLHEIEKSRDGLDNRYLRKDIDDTAYGVISHDKAVRSTIFIDGFDGGKGWLINAAGSAWFDFVRVRDYGIFGKGLGSEIFISGFPNGQGWDLSSYPRMNAAEVVETKWRLEIDDVIVRGKLRVFEFIISQLRGENDNVIFAGMMKVDHYDSETGRLYLQTDEGILYNPFRAGDILMMQRFGGLPSAGNNYNVIKQYELRVTEAYVGDLMAGKERLDYITFSHFVGDLPDIAEGDVLVRVDSFSDSTRKGIVKITTIDEVSAPNIDVVYGMKTDPMNATKARMGNLAGIRTKNNIDLTGVWGIYGNGAVFENSQIYLDNGMTIEQNFKVMNGQFISEINALKDQMAAESGNILQNPLFNENLYYWDVIQDVSVFRANIGLLWLNRDFYADKRLAAEIYRDGSRYVLRLKKTKISQPNTFFRFPEGSDKEGAYSFSFFYRAKGVGVLKAGIPGTSLYTEITLNPEDTYTKFSVMDEWDGIGDFIFESSGEVLIHSVSLFNDELANAVIKLQTQITQNEYEIALRATKQYVDARDGSILIEMEGKFSVTAEQISAVVRRTNNIENTIAEAGWITTADGNSLYAKKTLEDGNVIASYINQTATTVQIKASKIQLYGYVTFNMFDGYTQGVINQKITGDVQADKLILEGQTIIAGGYLNTIYAKVQEIVATRGSIAGFTINSNSIYANIISRYGDQDWTSRFTLSATDKAYIEYTSGSGGNLMLTRIGIGVDNNESGINDTPHIYIRNAKVVTKTSALNHAIKINLYAASENIFLEGNSQYSSIQLKTLQFGNDTTGFLRSVLKMTNMPSATQVPASNGNQYALWWDQKTGFFFIK